MLCFISFIFLLSIVAAIEAETITTLQAMWYGTYGLLMFYHTSKPYWIENQNNKNQKG